MVVLLVERVKKTEVDVGMTDAMWNVWMQFLTAVGTWVDVGWLMLLVERVRKTEVDVGMG